MGETTVLELLDQRGSPVGVGEAGEAVATNLWNYTMPLIRYRVKDHVVRGADVCDCGRPYPLVDHVVGRTGSSFVRPDGALVLPSVWIRLFGVVFPHPSIHKYQAVQEDVDRITLKIVLLPGREAPDEKFKRAVVEHINDMMGTQCRVDFVVVDDIPPTASGKFLYSVSALRSDAATTWPEEEEA
jgi:phenylacetate-CoA ligase